MARPRMTPANARRAIAVARLVAPVVTPYAMRAAGYARNRWDAVRARRLGIAVDQLSTLSGRGTALHARLTRLAMTLHELGQRRQRHAEFVEQADSRLADLATAMRAAETMPSARRRAAHRAVAAELDTIETEFLRRLGLDSTPPPR